MVDVKDPLGNTPLHQAYNSYPKKRIIKLLLKSGANISLKNNRNQTAENLTDYEMLKAIVTCSYIAKR